MMCRYAERSITSLSKRRADALTLRDLDGEPAQVPSQVLSSDESQLLNRAPSMLNNVQFEIVELHPFRLGSHRLHNVPVRFRDEKSLPGSPDWSDSYTRRCQ